MTIGEKVFCLDPKTRKVFEAETAGAFVSGGVKGSRGYAMINVVSADGTKQALETAHVHQTKEAAGTHAERVIPLMEDGEKLEEAFLEQANKLAVMVIGKPEHEDLAERIMKK